MRTFDSPPSKLPSCCLLRRWYQPSSGIPTKWRGVILDLLSLRPKEKSQISYFSPPFTTPTFLQSMTTPSLGYRPRLSIILSASPLAPDNSAIPQQACKHVKHVSDHVPLLKTPLHFPIISWRNPNMLQGLCPPSQLSLPLPFIHSSILLFLKHSKFTPSSWSLYVLLPLPGTFFP